MSQARTYRELSDLRGRRTRSRELELRIASKRKGDRGRRLEVAGDRMAWGSERQTKDAETATGRTVHSAHTRNA